ncbi:hypothetical protein [Hypericibacter sp.]|uniref:hypothetical protein n=1 Tax=Hypericibacter sp. TaxID=2705401 RepID=UPI003D6CF763
MARSLRVLGWVLLAVAAAFLGHDLVLLLKGGHWDTVSLGQAWGWLHEPSRDGLQAQLEALWPLLGRGAGVLLGWPVWVVFGVPGLLLSLAGRRSVKRRRWWS